MEEYLSLMAEFSYVGAGLGILLSVYAYVFMTYNTRPTEESNRVISTLTSVIRGEINTLRSERPNTIHENPYDLFTSIYPTLKEMDNERIEEFINLIEKYNSSWIDID